MKMKLSKDYIYFELAKVDVPADGRAFDWLCESWEGVALECEVIQRQSSISVVVPDSEKHMIQSGEICEFSSGNSKVELIEFYESELSGKNLLKPISEVVLVPTRSDTST